MKLGSVCLSVRSLEKSNRICEQSKGIYGHIYVKGTERYYTTMVVVINIKRKFPRSDIIT